MVHSHNVCIQPWFAILRGWGIYYDGLISEVQVDQVSLPLEVVGYVVDCQEWMSIQGVILDKHPFVHACIREEPFTEVGMQEIHETLVAEVHVSSQNILQQAGSQSKRDHRGDHISNMGGRL